MGRVSRVYESWLKGETGKQGPPGPQGPPGSTQNAWQIAREKDVFADTVTGLAANDEVMIIAKGTLSSFTTLETITLRINSNVVDSVSLRQGANTDRVAYCLVDKFIAPNSNDIVVDVITTGGNIINNKIITLVRRP